MTDDTKKRGEAFAGRVETRADGISFYPPTATAQKGPDGVPHPVQGETVGPTVKEARDALITFVLMIGSVDQKEARTLKQHLGVLVDAVQRDYAATLRAEVSAQHAEELDEDAAHDHDAVVSVLDALAEVGCEPECGEELGAAVRRSWGLRAEEIARARAEAFEECAADVEKHGDSSYYGAGVVADSFARSIRALAKLASAPRGTPPASKEDNGHD